MVAVFNKELLSWYLITLKLNEKVAARNPTSSRSRELSGDQQPPNDLLIDSNGDSGNPKEGPRSAESEWMITIREQLELVQKDDATITLKKPCIYKVSRNLRENDGISYIPNIVSLGPYHHGQKRFWPMDRHKWRAFDRILKRTNHKAKLYIDSIKELEGKARGCYEGHIPLNSNKFVEMMVLDGCFILELFRGNAGGPKGFIELGYPPLDPVFAVRGSMHSIQRDMIMLENQIPMFILDRLLALQLSQPEPNNFMVAKLALQFFNPLMPTGKPLTKTDLNKSLWFNPFVYHTHLHCLHVLRQSLLHSGPQLEPRRRIKLQSHWVADKRQMQLIDCVTVLKAAGIKFKKGKTKRFCDIKFKNGVLRIPTLFIHNGTKSLFLNLIEFEQTHLVCGNEITSYIIFMDNLINSPEDVGYLRSCGIFKHWLGSDSDVVDLFNGLCQEVVFDLNNNYLSELSKEVHKSYHRRCKWDVWQASLMHNYFNNPWSIISLIAAVILLILTFTQTFYGIYGYYRPP